MVPKANAATQAKVVSLATLTLVTSELQWVVLMGISWFLMGFCLFIYGLCSSNSLLMFLYILNEMYVSWGFNHHCDCKDIVFIKGLTITNNHFLTAYSQAALEVTTRKMMRTALIL